MRFVLSLLLACCLLGCGDENSVTDSYKVTNITVVTTTTTTNTDGSKRVVYTYSDSSQRIVDYNIDGSIRSETLVPAGSVQ